MINKHEVEIFLQHYKGDMANIPLLLLNADLSFSDLSKKSLLAESLMCIWKVTGYFKIEAPCAVELDEHILKEAKDVAIRATVSKNKETFREIAKMVAIYLHTIGTSVHFVVNELIETHKITNKDFYEEKISLETIMNNQREGMKRWEM